MNFVDTIPIRVGICVCGKPKGTHHGKHEYKHHHYEYKGYRRRIMNHPMIDSRNS